MSTVEKKLEKRLYNEVKKAGGKALKFFSYTFTGMPDRIVLMPAGRIYFVELKSTGKERSPRQKTVHKMLTDLGFKVYTIDTPEKLDSFLDEIILKAITE